jgi:hypothetical protein
MRRIDIPEDVLNSMLQGRASGLSYAKLAKEHGYKVDVVTRAIKECGLASETVKQAEKATLKLPAYWREPLKITRSKVLILQGLNPHYPCDGGNWWSSTWAGKFRICPASRRSRTFWLKRLDFRSRERL